MNDIVKLNKRQFEVTGHCKIDYIDPITEKVKERIEGDNHVFINQFICSDITSMLAGAVMFLHTGTQILDKNIPVIPGKPVGVGIPNKSGSGIYQGDFDANNSFINNISNEGISNLYTYNFSSAQVPDKINFIGLSASTINSNIKNTVFPWQGNLTDSNVMVDVRGNMLITPYISLSSSQLSEPKPNSIYVKIQRLKPHEEPVIYDLSELCEEISDYYGYSGYSACWGYDSDTGRLALCVTRYKSVRVEADESQDAHWERRHRDDIYIFDASYTSAKHYAYEYTDTDNNINPKFKCDHSMFARLKNNELIAFSVIASGETTAPSDSKVHEIYMYSYDIDTGNVYTEKYEVEDTLYFQKDTIINLCYYDDYIFPSARGDYNIERVMYIYNISNNEIYSYQSIGRSLWSYSLIPQTNLTNIYKNTWIGLKNNSSVYYPYLPFAYTCYEVPATAPERPQNTAIRVSYGLDLRW